MRLSAQAIGTTAVPAAGRSQHLSRAYRRRSRERLNHAAPEQFVDSAARFLSQLVAAARNRVLQALRLGVNDLNRRLLAVCVTTNCARHFVGDALCDHPANGVGAHPFVHPLFLLTTVSSANAKGRISSRR